jgi:glycosyltransferase involved in cell wall biosynthesis
MVGGARLHLHNLPAGSRYFIRTLGWQLPLIAPYLRRGVDLARQIKPQLVRTHNNFIEGVMASCIKRALGVPYIMSLHGVWDVDDRKAAFDWIRAKFREKLERRSLTSADAVIAVYAPIVRYARAHGAKRVELIYNIVAGARIEAKTSYRLATPPRLVTINRQVLEKNPANILRAVAGLDCSYTLIGDGPLHDSLRLLAVELGCSGRVEFIKSVPNADLCTRFKNFDLMVSHCDYWGMSKTIIEGGLAGLPIVINRHPKIPIEEYAGGWVVECENTPEGYRAAIADLLSSETRRRELGAKAREAAKDRFDPNTMERRTVALYRDVMTRHSAANPLVSAAAC